MIKITKPFYFCVMVYLRRLLTVSYGTLGKWLVLRFGLGIESTYLSKESMDNKLLFYFDKPMFFDFNIILKKGVIEEDGFARCLCFDFNVGLQEIIRCEDKMEVFEDGR